jgi:asparagine synthase (glutamine-hydrolysing)
MCGIAGIIGGHVELRRLDRMTDQLAHRGPDGRGVWLDERHEVGLGHRRLSILDVSDDGAQPMHSACGRFTITFNGEIYNYLELKDQLDYPFRTGSDTEVILAAYAQWGEACVERFNGMFAFAIWNHGARELFCARDRLGVKPFFLARHHNQYVFASEIKALLAAGVEARPNMNMWARYLANGEFEQPDESFFDGVSALKPGHTYTLKPDGSLYERRYWYLPQRIGEPWQGSESAAAAQLSSLLDDAVRLRLRSDVPVALNLSGGLDSSSVAQAFLRLSPNGQATHAFTASFDDPRYDEDQYAEQVVAGSLCLRHVTRLRPSEVPALAAQAMWSQEAPFGGIGMIAYEAIHHQMQRLGLKVALEGQGGDELFAGYNYFRSLPLLDAMDRGDCSAAHRYLNTMRPYAPVVRAARQVLEGQGNVYQDGSNYLAPECIVPQMRARATERSIDQPFDSRLMNALYRDLTATKLVRVLRMNDRISMAHGVELRQPFLDYRLVEFAATLPAHFKLHRGYGKYILRKAMDGKLPAEVIWTAKRPVVTPQREWMQHHLKDWVMDIIHDPRFRARGLFDVAAVQKTFDAYLRGGSENAFFIWQWINTELWFRAFIDTRPTY